MTKLFTSGLIFCQEGSNISHNIDMEKRVIIGFSARDLYTGCHPNFIEYGKVNNEDAALVKVRPGFVCLLCEAASRCKKKFTIVESILPSQVSHFSDS